MQVLDKGVLEPCLDHDVIDVGFNVAAQLRPKARLHRALEGSAGVPEAERHPGVAIAALRVMKAVFSWSSTAIKI